MTTTAERILDGILRVTLPLPSRPGHVHTYLLEGDDGWTLVDTGLGLPNAKERWAEELAGLEVRRDRDHAHAPGPRRCGRRRARPDRRGGLRGRARLPAVPARLGEPGLAEPDRRVVPRERGAVGRRERAARGRLPVRGLHPLRRRADAARSGSARRRLGGGADARPRRRAALPAQGRRPDRRRPSPHPDLARRRPLPGEPSRPARGLPRLARAYDRARRTPRPAAATARRSRTRAPAPGS